MIECIRRLFSPRHPPTLDRLKKQWLEVCEAEQLSISKRLNLLIDSDSIVQKNVKEALVRDDYQTAKDLAEELIQSRRHTAIVDKAAAAIANLIFALRCSEEEEERNDNTSDSDDIAPIGHVATIIGSIHELIVIKEFHEFAAMLKDQMEAAGFISRNIKNHNKYVPPSTPRQQIIDKQVKDLLEMLLEAIAQETQDGFELVSL